MSARFNKITKHLIAFQTLRVVVGRGKHFPAGDWHCSLQFGSQTCSTSITSSTKTDNPVWNQTFNFNLLDTVPTTSFTIEVFSKKKKTGENIFYGRAEINLTSLQDILIIGSHWLLIITEEPSRSAKDRLSADGVRGSTIKSTTIVSVNFSRLSAYKKKKNKV